jgi:hypothetical protein
MIQRYPTLSLLALAVLVLTSPKQPSLPGAPDLPPVAIAFDLR